MRTSFPCRHCLICARFAVGVSGCLPLAIPTRAHTMGTLEGIISAFPDFYPTFGELRGFTYSLVDGIRESLARGLVWASRRRVVPYRSISCATNLRDRPNLTAWGVFRIITLTSDRPSRLSEEHQTKTECHDGILPSPRGSREPIETWDQPGKQCLRCNTSSFRDHQPLLWLTPYLHQ